MGHLLKIERFGLDHKLESQEQYQVPGWEGVWAAVEAEMDLTGKTPSGMEGWEESGCALTPGHDCDERPGDCERYLRDAIREWVRSSWENNELRTGSFHFGGADWSAITFNWDGE